MTLEERTAPAFRGSGVAPEGASSKGGCADARNEPAPRPCRTNSRRGLIDPARRSYPPVEAVCRALSVLRAVNKLRIATINAIYAETHIPKPTILRLPDTLTAAGYLPPHNMCGGAPLTCNA